MLPGGLKGKCHAFLIIQLSELLFNSSIAFGHNLIEAAVIITEQIYCNSCSSAHWILKIKGSVQDRFYIPGVLRYREGSKLKAAPKKVEIQINGFHRY